MHRIPRNTHLTSCENSADIDWSLLHPIRVRWRYLFRCLFVDNQHYQQWNSITFQNSKLRPTHEQTSKRGIGNWSECRHLAELRQQPVWRRVRNLFRVWLSFRARSSCYCRILLYCALWQAALHATGYCFRMSPVERLTWQRLSTESVKHNARMQLYKSDPQEKRFNWITAIFKESNWTWKIDNLQ